VSQPNVAENQDLDRAIRQPSFAPEEGVYLLSEAADFAGLPRSSARHWLQIVRGEQRAPVIDGSPVVSFLELISLRAVVALRAARLSSSDIRAGLDRMRSELEFDLPLACEDLKHDGVDRFFRCARRVTANGNGHLAAQDLVDQYLRDVRYASVPGERSVAVSWEPNGVSLNPKIQRGAPCVRGTRIQVAVLKRFADAGDSPELLADMYDLRVDEVVTALTWYVQLKQRAA
jgi:uncharacterized protein (DUF433 family)